MATPCLAVEFRISRNRIYAAVPVNVRGFVLNGAGVFKAAPETCTEQCPGCGGDVAEGWNLFAENPGKRAEEDDAFRAQCDCGYRTTGRVVALD